MSDKENFVNGLKTIVQRPDSEEQTKLKALKLLLFTAVFDGDLERLEFAMDNGADARWGLCPGTRTILTNLGWEVPEMPNPESLDASYESSSQLQLSSEAYPCG